MRERVENLQCDPFIDSGVATVETVAQEIMSRRQRRQDLDTELRRLNLCSEDRWEGVRLVELLLAGDGSSVCGKRHRQSS